VRRAGVALTAALLLLPRLTAQVEVPKNDGWVTDLGKLLTPAQEGELERLAQSYQDGSGHDVAVLTVPDLGGRTIEELALATARSWRLGQRDLHDGALLVVARAERKVRIEVGRGLEGTVTDSICGRIIRHDIAPRFRAGQWADGLRAGLLAIHAAAGGAYAERGRDHDEPGAMVGLLVFAFLLLVVGLLVRRVRRRGALWAPVLFGLPSSAHRGFSGGRGGSFSGGGFGGFGGGGGFSGGGASGGW